MKLNPLSIILNEKFKLDKKFYFVSGNETTLMEKIKSKIIEKSQQNENVQIRNIETVDDFVDEIELFGEKKNIYSK